VEPCPSILSFCRELIQHLKHWAPGHLYATSLAPPAAQQIISALRLLRGEDGSDRGARKLAQLRENSDYFRGRLLDMGCNVLGDWGSPVMVGFGSDSCSCAACLTAGRNCLCHSALA
jgi:serine palmitoyltransferase